MANVSVIKLKVRRGSDVQRQLVTLDQGEIGYTTDSKRLFVGDGSTPGGISAGIKFYTSTLGITGSDSNLATIQTGDIVFDGPSGLFYILSGGSYDTYASYRPVQQINNSFTFPGPYKYSAGTGSVIPVSGTGNTASGNYSAIVGGQSNCTVAACTFVGGGSINCAVSSFSIIAGGCTNKTSGNFSFIGGGGNNTTCCLYSSVAGGNINVAYGACSFIGGGSSNTALSGGSTIGGGTNNKTNASTASILGGNFNCNSSSLGVIGGGFCNCTSGNAANVVGGCYNNALANHSSVVGGCCNVTSGIMSTIVGGFSSLNTGNYSYIGNGVCNSASANYSAVVGGFKSTNSACYAFIGGGTCNYIAPTTGNFSAVVGGARNCNFTSCSFIGGGASNCITNAQRQFIGAGQSNTICGSSSYSSVIVGGDYNYNTGNQSFIGAGCRNTASGAYAGIVGGVCNDSKSYSNTFILGSNLSASQANYTYVNNISSQGTVYGGAINATNGFYSTSSFNGIYTDGIVADYVTGQGRISVGPLDSITFFNGGPATTANVTISTNGYTTFNNSVSVNNNIYAGGNVFGGTNINVINGTSYTIQLSDNGGTIASTNSTTGLTALVNNTGYPVGFQTAVIQLSTARVAVSGNGFSVNQANSFYKTSKQYSATTLMYTGSIGGWVLFGDVSV